MAHKRGTLESFFRPNPKKSRSDVASDSGQSLAATMPSTSTAAAALERPSPFFPNPTLPDPHSALPHPQAQDLSSSPDPTPTNLSPPRPAPCSELPSTSGPSNPDVDGEVDYPALYTLEQWQDRRRVYPWLTCKNGKLGCEKCSQVSRLNLETEVGARGLSIAKEWSQFLIEASGANRDAQLASLRHKITKHHKTLAHEKCIKIVNDRKNKIMQVQLQEVKVKAHETTCRIFRTAYYLAKSNRPYADHEEIVELQKLNGVNIGTTLQGRKTATAVINCVADEMRRRLVTQIVQNESKLGVLIDESTTASKKAALVIYLHANVAPDVDYPEYIFLALIELESRKAEDVSSAVVTCLKTSGFTEKYLQDHWVSFSSDGASVMIGNKSGVGVRLKTLYPRLLLWHCLNHRLELALGDAVDSVGATFHFKSLLDKLYAHFSRSSQNQQDLADISAELEVGFLKIGRVLDVRWCASSFRTVKAIWVSLPALHEYFLRGSTDKERRPNVRSEMAGIARRLGSEQLIRDLGLMYDLLEELSSLSMQLQSREMTLEKADISCKRSIRVIDSFLTTPGTFYSEAVKAVEAGEIRGVHLEDYKRQVSIDPTALITELSKNMRDRLFGSGVIDHAESQTILKDLHVLNVKDWPEDENRPIRYGEGEVRRLCERFNLDTMPAIQGLREYVENPLTVPASLKQLKNLIATFSVSTAECERGFNEMNEIASDKRNRLLIESISSLMFIKVNGPPIKYFDPVPYVKMWMLHHRSATDSQVKPFQSKHVGTKQFWKYL